MQSPACCTVYVSLTATPLGLNTKRWFALPLQVATFTADPFPPLTCKHLPSMTDVIVPFLLRDHAPLQSHIELHDFGKGLHPQLQLTAAFSPVAQASISQQPAASQSQPVNVHSLSRYAQCSSPQHSPRCAAAIFTLVTLESPGTTPADRTHSCDIAPGLHSCAVKAPAGGPGGPGAGVLHSL